jgi:hypothetical protein
MLEVDVGYETYLNISVWSVIVSRWYNLLLQNFSAFEVHVVSRFVSTQVSDDQPSQTLDTCQSTVSNSNHLYYF